MMLVFYAAWARVRCLLLAIVAGVVAEGPPHPIARCNQVRACLRAKLPAEYNGGRLDIFDLKLEECAGATPQEISAANMCGPFRFAIDRRNGQALEVRRSIIGCVADLTRYGIAYADVPREEQCLCLSGSPGFDGGGPAYSGCFPAPDHSLLQRRAPITVRTEIVSPSIMVDTLHFGARTRFFQLEDRDIVETADGKPVEDYPAFRTMLQAMPELAPDTITVRRGARTVEVHYVSQEVLRDIERSLNDEHLFDIAPEIPNIWPKLAGYSTIIVGGRYRSWEPGKADPDSRSLDAVAAQIARIAKTARHLEPDPTHRFDCRGARDILKRIALMDAKRSIELSYIDWIDAGTRTPEKVAALRRDAESPLIDRK